MYVFFFHDVYRVLIRVLRVKSRGHKHDVSTKNRLFLHNEAGNRNRKIETNSRKRIAYEIYNDVVYYTRESRIILTVPVIVYNIILHHRLCEIENLQSPPPKRLCSEKNPPTWLQRTQKIKSLIFESQFRTVKFFFSYNIIIPTRILIDRI